MLFSEDESDSMLFYVFGVTLIYNFDDRDTEKSAIEKVQRHAQYLYIVAKRINPKSLFRHK